MRRSYAETGLSVVCPECEADLSETHENKEEAPPWFFPLAATLVVWFLVNLAGVMHGYLESRDHGDECRWPSTAGELFVPGYWVGFKLGQPL